MHHKHQMYACDMQAVMVTSIYMCVCVHMSVCMSVCECHAWKQRLTVVCKTWNMEWNVEWSVEWNAEWTHAHVYTHTHLHEVELRHTCTHTPILYLYTYMLPYMCIYPAMAVTCNCKHVHKAHNPPISTHKSHTKCIPRSLTMHVPSLVHRLHRILSLIPRLPNIF